MRFRRYEAMSVKGWQHDKVQLRTRPLLKEDTGTRESMKRRGGS
jgi:hypothetical protein